MRDYASGAALAKARAKYGKRLTISDFREMAGCRTVGEVAAFLKNSSHFSSILASINEGEIHRAQLEGLLRENVYNDLYTLSAYDRSSERFPEFFIKYYEISQILKMVSAIKSGLSTRYTPPHFETYSRFSQIDFRRFLGIKTFDDLTEALKGTGYYSLLLPFRPEEAPLDYAGIETTLYNQLFSVAYRDIEKVSSKSVRRELTDLMDAYVDISNYFLILRLKFIYQAPSHEIQSRINPFGLCRNPRRLRQALEAESAAGLARCFRGIVWAAGDRELTDASAQDLMLYRKFVHQLRFSTSPLVVLFSYFVLSVIEVFDVTTVIEGVRYGLPSANIQELLTIIHTQGGD